LNTEESRPGVGGDAVAPIVGCLRSSISRTTMEARESCYCSLFGPAYNKPGKMSFSALRVYNKQANFGRAVGDVRGSLGNAMRIDVRHARPIATPPISKLSDA